MKKTAIITLIALIIVIIVSCAKHSGQQPSQPAADAAINGSMPADNITPEVAVIEIPAEQASPVPTPEPEVTQKEVLALIEPAKAEPKSAVHDKPAEKSATPHDNKTVAVDNKNIAYDNKTEAPQFDTDAYAEKSYIYDGRYLHPWAQNPIKSAVYNGQKVPWANEELEFGIYWSFVRAGTAYIKSSGITDTDFGPAYRVETVANSSKTIDSLFKVRDVNYSWISADDFSSYGYSQSVREGKYSRDEWVVFDIKRKMYYGMLRNNKGNRKTITGEVPSAVQDMLTALFYVRKNNIYNNDNVTFDVANREQTYPLEVKVIKRETVKVPAGKFKCIMVEPAFRGEGIFIRKGKDLKVWLTDDERMLPIKLEVEVFIGSVSATLEKYK